MAISRVLSRMPIGSNWPKDRVSSLVVALIMVLGCLQLIAAPRTDASIDFMRAAPQISVSKSSVRPRASFAITGRVPATTDRVVQLQRLTGRTWRRVASLRTLSRGQFTFRIQAPPTPGRLRYRVHAPATRGRIGRPASTTRVVAVTVIDPLGSRTNPYRLGQSVRVDDWTVRIDATDYDAYPEMDHDIADPPGAGWSYVSNAATYTYRGAGGSSPWLDMSMDFLASDNRIYDRDSGGQWCSGVEPDVIDLEDMYAGATASAHECASVPITLASGGLWRIRPSIGSDVFVRAS